MSEATRDLLRIALAAAVPLWIAELRLCSVKHRMERALVCGQHVAEHGDVVQFHGGKKGASAEAFNRLAEGLACLAFQPGGVTFLGDHWEVKL